MGLQCLVVKCSACCRLTNMSLVLKVLACSLGIYCCQPHKQVTEIVEPEEQATSAIIFLHGAGGCGKEMREVVENYIGSFSQFPNTRFIFPTADAVQFPAFPWNGQIINMWFSFNSLDINYIFNTTEMENSTKRLERLIDQQVASGIPHRNICLVGYSSGGMMAIIIGYGYVKNLGCIGAISAYLSTDSDIYEKISIEHHNSNVRIPPLFMYGGGLDIVVRPSWVKETINKLECIGIPVIYNYQWSGTHFINKDGLESLFQFIKTHLFY